MRITSQEVAKKMKDVKCSLCDCSCKKNDTNKIGMCPDCKHTIKIKGEAK